MFNRPFGVCNHKIIMVVVVIIIIINNDIDETGSLLSLVQNLLQTLAFRSINLC